MNRMHLLKWLQIMMYTYTLGIVVSVLSVTMDVYGIFTSLTHLLSAFLVFCCFQLRKVRWEFREAALWSGVTVALQLLQVVLGVVTLPQEFSSSFAYVLLTWVLLIATSLCSFQGLYYACHGYSHLCEDLVPHLRRKWLVFFKWNVIIGIAASLGSALFAELGMVFPAAVIALIYGIAGLVFEVVRIRWLRQMLRALTNQ